MSSSGMNSTPASAGVGHAAVDSSVMVCVPVPVPVMSTIAPLSFSLNVSALSLMME